MATYFDPQALRKSFEDFALEMELSEEMSAYEPNSVGNASLQRLATIIEAWLVGLHQEIRPALESCREWFASVADKAESFGLNPTYHAAQKLDGYAVCVWMNEGVAREDLYRAASRLHERSWKENSPPLTPREIVELYLEDYLLDCIQCKDYQRGLEVYESVKGLNDPAKSEFVGGCEFAGWLCHHLLRSPSEVDEVLRIGGKFLQANLESNWLRQGQAIKAAAWLKVILWDTRKTTSALEVIVRAYDYMPHVKKPAALPST